MCFKHLYLVKKRFRKLQASDLQCFKKLINKIHTKMLKLHLFYFMKE